MANAFKVLYRGSASTSSATLYTVPAATNTLVTTLVVTNTAGSAATYTISINGVEIVAGTSVPANDSIVVELKQVIESGNSITGFASATSVRFHLSGLEIS